MVSKIVDEIEGPFISLRLLAAPEHSFSIGDNNIVYAVKIVHRMMVHMV